MRLTPVILLFIIGLFHLTACHPTSDGQILKEAQAIIETAPDSALFLLEERLDPSSLEEADKALYWFLTTAAHVYKGSSLVNDSMINYSVEYYRKINEPNRLFNALRFAAWQIHSGSKDKKRQEGLWLEALSIAEELKNPELLSEAYTRLSAYYEDEGKFEKAIAYSHRRANLSSSDRTKAYYTIGLNYSKIGNRDSCRQYMTEAIRLAQEQKSPNINHYLRNYADHLAKEAPEEALRILNEARILSPDAMPLLSYASVYKQLGQMDSAFAYLAKLQDTQKSSGLSDAAWKVYTQALEALWKVEKGEPSNFERIADYCDSVAFATDYALQNEKELLLSQNKLQQKILKAENRRQQTLTVLFILLFCFTVTGSLAFFYIRNRRERLLETEEKLEALQQLLQETRTDPFFRKILLQQLGLIRLVATTPTQQNKELLQQMSRIVNNDLPADTLLIWKDLYPIIDSVYDNFHTRLIQLANKRLSEKEIQICCLLCANFSTKEISVVTGQSVRTIYQRKTNIRHALGMEEKDDIAGFINAQQ